VQARLQDYKSESAAVMICFIVVNIQKAYDQLIWHTQPAEQKITKTTQNLTQMTCAPPPFFDHLRPCHDLDLWPQNIISSYLFPSALKL